MINDKYASLKQNVESRKQRPRLSGMFPAGAVCVGGSSCAVKFFLIFCGFP